MLTTALLWTATTFFTAVGLVSATFMAITAIRLFWRSILVAIGAIIFARYTDVRPFIEAFFAIGLLGWGCERWRNARDLGDAPFNIRRFARLAG